MNYNTDELVDMTLIIGECQRNCFLASRVYAQRYPNRRHPQAKCFVNLLDRFMRTANANYEKSARQGRVSSNEDKEFFIVASAIDNPHTSVRKVAEECGISKSSVNRTLKKYNFHPYKIKLQQALTNEDFQSRVSFCQWAVSKHNEDDNFFKYVLFTDESSFSSTGRVNGHNFHYYGSENPNICRFVDNQHRFTVNVWAGIVGVNLIGPYFFDGHLNGPRYLSILEDEMENLLENLPLGTTRRMWFMQDGAPSHYDINVRRFLNERYPNRWIGRGGPVSWPARSPDLTCLDFFLWGYVKERVYQTPSNTPQELRNKIESAFRTITPQILDNVQKDFLRRVRLCIEVNGQHFET